MKFNIIYADPPYSYFTWNKNNRGTAEKFYDTLMMEDIIKLDVKSISSENCALLLWITSPYLFRMNEILDSWGFKYKSVAFTWIKKTVNNKLFWGMGHWTRSNPEYCLLATKGKMTRVAKNVHSVIEHPVTKHSQKPPQVRTEIKRLFGDLPSIELFAREREHWDGFL
jgi:N6-adenosine-specific RNA methylase IME4